MPKAPTKSTPAKKAVIAKGSAPKVVRKTALKKAPTRQSAAPLDVKAHLEVLLTQLQELHSHYEKSAQDCSELMRQIEALMRVSQSAVNPTTLKIPASTNRPQHKNEAPISEGDLYLHGLEFLAKQQFEAALDCFNRLLTMRPKHLDAQCQKGNVLYELKRFDQAISAFEKAIQIEPKSSAAFLSLGLAFHAKGEYEKAITAYQKALAINPQDFMVYRNFGNALNELKRYDEALAQYDQALQIKPDSPVLWFGKATVFSNVGKTLGALDCYTKAISLDPQYADAHFYLALTQMKAGSLQKALESFERVLLINPLYDGVNIYREQILSALNRSE